MNYRNEQMNARHAAEARRPDLGVRVLFYNYTLRRNQKFGDNRIRAEGTVKFVSDSVEVVE